MSWAAALSTVLFSFFYLGSALAYPAMAGYHYPTLLRTFPGRLYPGLLLKSAANASPGAPGVRFLFFKKTDRKFWLSKIPYFVFSLLFGAYTFITRAQEGHDIETASGIYSLVDRFWMICQTLLFYPVKLLIPLGFSVSYPFIKTAGTWPWTYYAAPVVLAGLAFAVGNTAGRTRHELLLGLALYLLPLCVMLPFRTVGSFETAFPTAMCTCRAWDCSCCWAWIGAPNTNRAMACWRFLPY